MVNVEQYISGGIIESYVLGIADEQERYELETLLPLYPEIRAAVQGFETEIERYALMNAIQPPRHVRHAVGRRIGAGSSQKDRVHNGNGNGERFIPIVSESSNQIRVHKFWRYAFIAVFVLSKVFLFFAIYYYFLYKEAAKERDNLQHTLQQQHPSK